MFPPLFWYVYSLPMQAIAQRYVKKLTYLLYMVEKGMGSLDVFMSVKVLKKERGFLIKLKALLSFLRR